MVAALLAACSSGTRHGLPPTTVAGPTSTVAPAGAAYRWDRLTSATLAVGGGAAVTIAAVIAPAAASLPTGPGSSVPAQGPGPWIAAGTRTNADGTTAATVWTSADALTWSATPLSSSVDSRADAATTWGARTVVVGSIGDGPARRAAVWLSRAPGAAFAAVPSTAAFVVPAASGAGPIPPEPGARMNVVAGGAVGLFAAGRAGGSQAMWYSTDGEHWTRLAGAEKVLNSVPDADVRALLVTSKGTFAAGSNRDGLNTDGALWSSADGINWGRVHSADQTFTGSGDHAISGLVSLGTGLVAVGGVRTTSVWAPTSWISPDGSSWSPASPLSGATGTAASSGADPGGAIATAVAVNASGLVATGGGPVGPEVWTSTNGLTWQQAPLPAAAAGARWQPDLVASAGATSVVADDTPGQPHLLTETATGWQEVTSDPAVFGVPWTVATPARLLATPTSLAVAVNASSPGQSLGHPSNGVSVLASPDGSAWTPTGALPSSAGSSQLRDLASTAAGLIAAGVSNPQTAAATGQAWLSADGATWAADPAFPLPTGSIAAPSEVSSVSDLGGTLVAVGASGTPSLIPATAGGSAAAGEGTTTTSAVTSTTTTPASTAIVPTTSSAAAPTSPTNGRLAVSWTSLDGKQWQPDGPLDVVEAAGWQEATGTCTSGLSVVTVGFDHRGGDTTDALAWSSADGVHWQAAKVPPATLPGGSQVIDGCIHTSTGFVAYGSTTDGGGATTAALWQSPDGRQWVRQAVSGFAGIETGPISDIAVHGPTWMAVSPADFHSDGVGPDKPFVLWRSTDTGITWQRVDTSGTPWIGRLRADADEVAFVGDLPVVSGQVDGQLAVWVGTPTAGPLPNPGTASAASSAG